MSAARVTWDLARGRTPSADAIVLQRVVDRLDRALVGQFVVAVVALLTLLRVAATTLAGRPDRVGPAAGVVLVLADVAALMVRRRALATAVRLGHPPRRSWT